MSRSWMAAWQRGPLRSSMDSEQPQPSPPRKPVRMTLTTWIIIASIVAAFLLFKHLTQVKPATARAWLSKGALVIDVRTEAEFRKRHLPGVINIPLNRLGDEIVRQAPDKEHPLLLHCLSGTRSGMAKGILQKLGYQHVFNLGSYGRAAKILAAPRGAGGKD